MHSGTPFFTKLFRIIKLRLCRNFIDLGMDQICFTICFVLTYSKKLAPKTNNFSKTQSDISIDIVSKRLKDIEDLCPSSQSRIWTKKIVCTKKAYKIDSVASIWIMGTLLFNWNDLYELQRNSENLSFCLNCYEIHWKVHTFSIFGT